MAVIVPFPASMRPSEIDLRLVNTVQHFNAALTGRVQAASNISSRWVCTIRFSLSKYSVLHSYNAMVAKLGGIENVLELPLDRKFFLVPDEAAGLGVTPHSDGAYFSDGAGYAVADISGVTVTCARGAASAAADLSAYNNPLVPGMYFGIDNDLYICTGFADGTVSFRPGARRDYSGAALRFRPVLRARLREPDGGGYTLPSSRLAAPEITLEEAIL